MQDLYIPDCQSIRKKHAMTFNIVSFRAHQSDVLSGAEIYHAFDAPLKFVGGHIICITAKTWILPAGIFAVR